MTLTFRYKVPTAAAGGNGYPPMHCRGAASTVSPLAAGLARQGGAEETNFANKSKQRIQGIRNEMPNLTKRR